MEGLSFGFFFIFFFFVEEFNFYRVVFLMNMMVERFWFEKVVEGIEGLIRIVILDGEKYKSFEIVVVIWKRF